MTASRGMVRTRCAGTLPPGPDRYSAEFRTGRDGLTVRAIMAMRMGALGGCKPLQLTLQSLRHGIPHLGVVALAELLADGHQRLAPAGGVVHK